MFKDGQNIVRFFLSAIVFILTFIVLNVVVEKAIDNNIKMTLCGCSGGCGDGFANCDCACYKLFGYDIPSSLMEVIFILRIAIDFLVPLGVSVLFFRIFRLAKNQTVKQKRFAILQISIIIVLLGAVGYLLYQNAQLQKNGTNTTSLLNLPTKIPTKSLPKASPTSGPTANWKTYQNDSVGFSFKYPETFTNKNITVVELYGNSKKVLTVGNKQFSLSVGVISNPNAQTIELSTRYAEETKQIGSHVAYLEQAVSAEGWFFTTAYIPLKGYLIFIGIEPEGGTPEETEAKSSETLQMQDQILSTFKFTE